MTFALAAAGTGGHVYPALAVADALVEVGTRRDDIVFFGGDRMEAETIFIQYTSGDHHSKRRDKILRNDIARQLNRMEFAIHVLSWRKPAGKARYVSRCEVVDFSSAERVA